MAPNTLAKLCLVAGLATSTVLAAPAPTPFGAPRCEDYGECVDVEVFGYKTQRLVHNTTAPALGRRQDSGETRVEAGNDQVEQRTIAFQDGTPPDASFNELWDRILEACLSTFLICLSSSSTNVLQPAHAMAIVQ